MVMTGANTYFSLENENARLAAIDKLYQTTHDEVETNFDTAWSILCSIPTRLEKARLAHVLRTSVRPGNDWALVTALTFETDQDVIGNSINALTLSKNRALGHRLTRLFASPERPQRVLYCLARYAEEAIDPRLAKFLAPTLAHDLSDAFLARTFNALFRLGVKDSFAIKVASDLVFSHLDATNMDRKAAVSAILYLCFAASRNDLESIWAIKDRVAIPELRRLLNWGRWHISQVGQNNFNETDAIRFLKASFREPESNYTGYGCFKSEILSAAFKSLVKDSDLPPRSNVVNGILALGDVKLIELLAVDEVFGIKRAAADKDIRSLELWKQFAPFESAAFMKSVRDESQFDIWHKQNPELLFCVLDSSYFVDNGSWQNLFIKKLESDPLAALDILCGFVFAVERETMADAKTEATSIENIFKNLETLKKSWPKHQGMNELTERIYGSIVGGRLAPIMLGRLIEILPADESPWVLEALAVTPKAVDSRIWQHLCTQLIAKNNTLLKGAAIDESVFVAHLILLEQAIVCGFEKNGLILEQKVLGDLEELVTHTQAILNTIHQPTSPIKQSDDDEAEFDEHADWAGQVHRDLPLLRWNAVLQIALHSQIEKPFIANYEAVLVDSMRVSPHVDKRWIVHALAKLSTDDAIKAILYGAFQHVDSEFVAHTIRELLHSRHPRAQQALIRSVGRNTVSDDLKLTILEEISLENPEDVLQELKTLEILRLPQHIDEAVKETIGRVAALVKENPDKVLNQENEVEPAAHIDVDSLMRQMLPEADALSIDALSALRTAEMILVQSRGWRTEAVDLSPIVNMHFKAVELTMRENFEAYTDSVIRKGLLSRKLDIVGYARPIPEKMQVFEDYLANLPVVKSIPYFSKFKLRKMLRAICLYRPGKRFTLDGPKAFALFFLVCSRKHCQFGLEKIIELPYKTDNDLFEFIKLVHSLQDSRNRAVHEGLTWEAKDEIEAFRKQAYTVIEHCIKIGKFLKTLGGQG